MSEGEGAVEGGERSERGWVGAEVGIVRTEVVPSVEVVPPVDDRLIVKVFRRSLG